MNDIIELMKAVNNSERNLAKELKRRWPEGSEIMVRLNYRQRHPSKMIVMGHDGQGYVRAKMRSDKCWRGFFVKNVYFKDILQ